MATSAWSRLLSSLRHPLIQAPMAGVQDSGLAVAVSRAGALGSLPAAMLDVAGLERELHVLQRELGAHGLPYNINFFCHQPPKPDAQRDAAWRQALAPYYEQWGLAAPESAAAPSRQPFNSELADVLGTNPPPVVSFHFGLPSPALLERVKAWGSVVLSSATTVEEALWLRSQGVDAVIAQGLEAGGHRGHFLRPDDDLSGQEPLLSLLSSLEAVSAGPVVAAGGLGCSADVRQALQAGAQAVQVGTAFLLCDEAKTPALHRRALERAAGAAHAAARQKVGAGDGDGGDDGSPRDAAAQHQNELTSASTALTRLFTGRPARGLINRLMRELGPMTSAAPAFPLAGGALAPLRQRAEALGLDDFSPLWSGTRLQACRAVSAADVVQSLMSAVDEGRAGPSSSRAGECMGGVNG